MEACGILVADITINGQKCATLSRKYKNKVLANNLFALRVPSNWRPFKNPKTTEFRDS